MRDPLSLHAYRLVSMAVAPLAPAYLRRRARRDKEDLSRLNERLGHPRLPRPEGPLVWLHGASVGELVSVVPLAGALTARGLNVLVTSGTVTSARIAVQRLPTGAFHQFAPIDTPRATRRFIEHWRPDAGVFVESELWPNLVRSAADTGTALAIVNGRMSERSAAGWKRAPGFIRALLGRFPVCLTQTEADAARYRSLGAPDVRTVGNLKFDADALPVDALQLAEMRNALAERPVFVAASTHPGEEEIVVAAHLAAAQRLPGLVTVIAPRHPDRGQPIAALAEQAGLKARRRALGERPDAETDLYIADTVGEMGLVYRLGPLAFVGGSFAPRGGQNPIEPAKLGVAILHGPDVFNFTDVYAAFDADGGSRRLDSPDALGVAVATLIGDPAALAAMQRHAAGTADRFSGAMARTLEALAPVLPHGGARP